MQTDGLVVDSTFERSENVGEFELVACSEGCGLHHYGQVRSCFHLRMRIVLTGTRLYIPVARC